jgi:ribonuclease VapC
VTCVLDASAALAVILNEEGADVVLTHMAEAHFSMVNLAETIAKLIEYGLTAEQARDQIDRLDLNQVPFDQALAVGTALLRQTTKVFGLSLGDRACLALGQHLSLPILTSDRRMAESSAVLGLDIRLIR